MRCLHAMVVGVASLLLISPGALHADDDLPGAPVRPQPGEVVPAPRPPTPQPVPPTARPGPPAPAVQPPTAPPPKRAATPDCVWLKNGSKWEGRIVRDDAKGIRLERVSPTGGVTGVMLPRADIDRVQRGHDQDQEPAGSKLVRNEWFLLHADGRVAGTRNVRVSRVTTSALDGWRIEEEILEFARGPRLPATRIRTVEVTDKTFHPVLVEFRETTEGNVKLEDRYERRVSGRVAGGVWSCARVMDGQGDVSKVSVPHGTRGRLGHREHCLRRERAVGLSTETILHASHEGLVEVRTGFVSVEDTPNPRGDEFHWEFEDRRLISYFTRDHRATREEIAEGVVAMPASEAQCTAASDTGNVTADKDEANPAIALPVAGFRFRKPGPIWTWKQKLDQPGNTGKRVLGVLKNEVLVANALVMWHPESFYAVRDDQDFERTLLQEMRSQDAALRVLSPRRAISRIRGAWRMDVQATLRGDDIRTAVIVLDRRPARAVILFACPAAAWPEGEGALGNLLNSIESL